MKNIETNRALISQAVDLAMMEMDGLPSHVYVTGLAACSREELDVAAEAANAWVREYDLDDSSAVVACR